MKEKKATIDAMIQQGFILQFPYFWYLENCEVKDLEFLWKIHNKDN